MRGKGHAKKRLGYNGETHFSQLLLIGHMALITTPHESHYHEKLKRLSTDKAMINQLSHHSKTLHAKKNPSISIPWQVPLSLEKERRNILQDFVPVP